MKSLAAILIFGVFISACEETQTPLPITTEEIEFFPEELSALYIPEKIQCVLKINENEKTPQNFALFLGKAPDTTPTAVVKKIAPKNIYAVVSSFRDCDVSKKHILEAYHTLFDTAPTISIVIQTVPGLEPGSIQ